MVLTRLTMWPLELTAPLDLACQGSVKRSEVPARDALEFCRKSLMGLYGVNVKARMLSEMELLEAPLMWFQRITRIYPLKLHSGKAYDFILPLF